MSFSIGPIELQGNAVLAPLAAVTSAPFREICLQHGCSYAVTEMIASEALVRDVPGAIVRMERAASERVLAVQLFGSDPRVMARAAELAVRAGASIVDVNMGCPVRKILGCGAGVALMREPDKAEAIVRAMVAACASAAVVTVKMRAGWDDQSITAPALAKRLEDAGAAAVAVHARTRDQVHGGASRWEVIHQVKQSVRIPVIGNGGIKTEADARAMMEATGCDAVMIGRGALGNPWIFQSIARGVAQPPSIEQRFAVIRQHLALYVVHSGERKASLEIRKHLGWYLRGMPGSSAVRAQLQTMTSAERIEAVIGALEQSLLQGDLPLHPQPGV